MLCQTYRPSTSNIFWNFPVLVLLFLLPIDSTSKLFWTFSFLYSQESYLIHYIHTYINLYYIFYLCLFMFLYGRRKWQLTPVFLPRELRGQRNLVGCCPYVCTESDTTEATQHACMHWRRKWQPTPAFLPRESQRQRSLVGCHLWGLTELDMTEATQQQQQKQHVYIFIPYILNVLYFLNGSPPHTRARTHTHTHTHSFQTCTYHTHLNKNSFRYRPPLFLPFVVKCLKRKDIIFISLLPVHFFNSVWLLSSLI